jgi:uridylate kinase
MKRILLKLSGEFLKNETDLWDLEKINAVVDQLKRLHNEDFQLALVVGGGNIFRGGRNACDFDRCNADEIGMAATCLNALFLRACFQKFELPAVVFGTSLCGGNIEAFNLECVHQCLVNRTVVLFAGGTGHAFFSTDTAAALRACEIKADLLLKATDVDGIFNKDPKRFPDAKRFEHLTYKEACEGHYAVMDACAFELCREQLMPLFVFNVNRPNAIYEAAHGQGCGTRVGA